MTRWRVLIIELIRVALLSRLVYGFCRGLGTSLIIFFNNFITEMDYDKRIDLVRYTLFRKVQITDMLWLKVLHDKTV